MTSTSLIWFYYKIDLLKRILLIGNFIEIDTSPRPSRIVKKNWALSIWLAGCGIRTCAFQVESSQINVYPSDYFIGSVTQPTCKKGPFTWDGEYRLSVLHHLKRTYCDLSLPNLTLLITRIGQGTAGRGRPIVYHLKLPMLNQQMQYMFYEGKRRWLTSVCTYTAVKTVNLDVVSSVTGHLFD